MIEKLACSLITELTVAYPCSMFYIAFLSARSYKAIKITPAKVKHYANRLPEDCHFVMYLTKTLCYTQAFLFSLRFDRIIFMTCDLTTLVNQH